MQELPTADVHQPSARPLLLRKPVVFTRVFSATSSWSRAILQSLHTCYQRCVTAEYFQVHDTFNTH